MRYGSTSGSGFAPSHHARDLHGTMFVFRLDPPAPGILKKPVPRVFCLQLVLFEMCGSGVTGVVILPLCYSRGIGTGVASCHLLGKGGGDV